MTSQPYTRSMRAIGTTAIVAVTDPRTADAALQVLAAELDAIDRACSRFRHDSEIQDVHRAGGAPVQVSPLLFAAIDVALAVAERTGGAVDPTVGSAVCSWGYDRDFERIPTRLAEEPLPVVTDGLPAGVGRRAARRRRHDAPARLRPYGQAAPIEPIALPPGWWQVEIDRKARTVRVPPGTVVDLGATAKALVADRAAARIARTTGSGVLVSVGGDIATAGRAPADGWAVGIAPTSNGPLHAIEQVVAVHGGGLASSSPGVRAWMHGDLPAHHIIDPATGAPAARQWRLVSAAGDSCVQANAATTAAVVWGADAPDRLRSLRQPARLASYDGRIVTVNGWPEPDADRPGGGRPPAATRSYRVELRSLPATGTAGSGSEPSTAPVGRRGRPGQRPRG